MRNPDSLKLVYQDGTSWNLLNSDNLGFVCYGASPYAEEQIYDDIDCPIFSSSFNKPIDVEQVEGIWINGVYYELK